MKIAILGFGREGRSLLKFLRKSPDYKNAEIWILDKKLKIKSPDTINRIGIKTQTGKNYLKNLKMFDVIFRSPGAPYNLPEIQRAIKKGVKFSSATKLFFDLIRGTTQTIRRRTQTNFRVGQRQIRVSPRPVVIGITGTKGKGTTATLLYRILKACDKPAYLAGNIGKPVIEILPKIKKGSIVIIELSSFQLQDLKKPPEIAVVLDIFPDHLDAHKNFSEYIKAKANIAKYQKESNKIFYFSDNKYCRWIAQKSRGKKIPVGSYEIRPIRYAQGRPEFVEGRNQYENIELKEELTRALKLPGEHNLKNAVMAAKVALSLGCPREKIVKVIKNFRGNEHRLELVRTIKTRTHADLTQTHAENFRVVPRTIPRRSAIIRWYNDSASTNPQTAAAAIKAFSEPKILIAGGKDKNLNYYPLAKALNNSSTKLVILFGENKKKIKKQIAGRKTQILLEKNLKSAVNLAYKTAKKLINLPTYKLITIVFSPASASFDMFRNYAERGKEFKVLVRRLK